MIDSKKPCPGCNHRDEKGRMMHLIENVETKTYRGYWCPRCNNWEDIELSTEEKPCMTSKSY